MRLSAIRPVSCAAAILALTWTAAAARPRHIDRSGKTQVGRASFEGHADAGKTTASGKAFSPRKLTAASRTLPLGTKAEVTNPANGKSVAVTVIDRGPYAKKRILDVSSKAAGRLGIKKKGVAKVEVTPLSEPPPKPR
jgi:rare lipoprotein A